jgi:hypothetical protein
MNTIIKFATVTLLIILGGLSFQSCFYSNGGFGNRVEEERNVGDFSALRVSSGIDVTLLQGNRTQVIIITDEDNLEDVKTEKVGGELRLSVDGSWFRRSRVEARITFVNIESLDVSAGSDVESEGPLQFRDINIEASSGSDLKLTLEANEVSLRTSSGSDARLEGKARNLYAKASSGSDINAFDFEVEHAELELSSGSDVKIWVSGSLNVDASSGSDVYYRGDPELLDINTSGGSDINKR